MPAFCPQSRWPWKRSIIINQSITGLCSQQTINLMFYL
jgi:hypothetical protein